MPVTRPRWLPRKAGDLSCLTSSGFQQEANICSGKNVPRHPWTYHKWDVLHLDAIYLTLYAPCTPCTSVSKEPEQKGAPPIERFHHPGTERVTSAERNKDREPITHLPPIVARHPGTGHFLRRNKDLPRPCLVPQLTSWNNGLGNLTIQKHVSKS